MTIKHLCHLVLLMVVLVFSRTASAEVSSRYWYSSTCENRFKAAFEELVGDTIILRMEDDTRSKFELGDLSPSERRFVDAIKNAREAATHLEESRWRPEKERQQMERLLTRYRVPPYRAVFSGNEPDLPYMQFPDLRGRWIEIRGVEYFVVAAREAVDATAYDHLVVVDPNFGSATLQGSDVPEFHILPSYWTKRNYQPRISTTKGNPFRQRGWVNVSVHRPFIPDEMYFASGNWTNREIALALPKIEATRTNFHLWENEYRLAEACWNYHKGNQIASRCFQEGWIDAFPYHSGKASNAGELLEAQAYYDEAFRLAPDWGEPLLRSAAIDERVGRLASAHRKIDQFSSLPGTWDELPIPVRSHKDLESAAIILRARLLVISPRPWQFGDGRVTSLVDSAISEIQKIASESSAAMNLAPRLLKNLLVASTQHFEIRRDQYYAEDPPELLSLFAAISASKYGSHRLADVDLEGVSTEVEIDLTAEVTDAIARSQEQIDLAQFRKAYNLALGAVERSRESSRSQDVVGKADAQLSHAAANWILFNLNYGL
ncbi:hypothetical protein Pan97_22730 [Bremerella volcania]|uniref:Tetratricopeptide repeat protein n=1 Tax=Bremerella volcania TaxID=2527984 RepID=A0A518C7Q2_9BACT|nr:hypothetical protein [Bremerella volcania]QDU75244.1 hypothetical protein Pan97_22730 [Bremerella volcania]